MVKCPIRTEKICNSRVESLNKGSLVGDNVYFSVVIKTPKEVKILNRYDQNKSNLCKNEKKI